MAKSLNRVDLLGYLGDDIRIKEFRDGTSVGEVSVATDYGMRDASGAWTQCTEWHSVVIWGAAAASEVLVKGARVHLTGRLRTRAWEAEGGEMRHKTEVVCNAHDVIVTWLPSQGDAPSRSAPEGEGNGEVSN